jgi:hypothetical protein
MDEQGTSKNPLVMKVIPPEPPGLGALIRMTILTVAPIAVAIIMQKPALRQAIVMRATHEAKYFCQRMADFWQDMALKAGTAYNKAKL